MMVKLSLFGRALAETRGALAPLRFGAEWGSPVAPVARVWPICSLALTNKGNKTAMVDRGGTHEAEHVDGAPGWVISGLGALGIKLGREGRVHGPD
jgi:hypothetical protein